MDKKKDYSESYFFTEPQPVTPEPVEELKPWAGETRIVGKKLPRVDAYERVSGTAEFTFDINLPRMLHGAILRCPHAHAKVKSIDIAKAEEMPGVHVVMTGRTQGADIPWYGRANAPESKLFGRVCRYAGEEIAAVAAETPQQAWDAVRAIKAEYEELPFVLDPEEALKPDAPRIHESGNQVGAGRQQSRGDLEKGFAEADVIAERTYTVGTHIHVPMESFGSVAKWDGDELTIWDSTQGVYSVMFNVARSLQMPFNKVRVICKYMGGAFGSKLTTGKYTVIAALMARMTGRPVKIFLTREESYICVGNRPGAKMTIKAGVKKDGTLTALHLKNIASPGAYSGGAAVGFQVMELYKCPNAAIDESFAYTNVGPGRPMRAPGFPQCSWALEQMMDELAEKVGMDPIGLRLKNISLVSQSTENNDPYTSTGLEECLVRGAEEFGWKEARAKNRGNGHIRRGVGIAAGVWSAGAGGPPSTATANMFVDGSVVIKTGAMDIGTGTKTVACMVAAEELGLPIEQIKIVNADTGTTPYHYSSGGSMTLPGAVPTVRLAVADVKRQLFEFASEDLEVPADDLEIKDGAVVSRSDPEKSRQISQIIQSRRLMNIVGTGYRGPNPEGKAIRPFGAHFAEVEVNTKTGEVKLVRMLGAHESGRVINRMTYDNQVLGGMTQGIGFGMSEHRVMDRQTGRMCNVNWHDYKIPTAMDVPADHMVVAVDPNDMECNNLGAKGLGEPPVIPAGAAIANAVYDAIGIRVTDAPIYPPRLIKLLAEKGKRG